MAVIHSQRELDALAAAGLALANADTLAEALQIVADGAAGAAHADVAIVRADVDGRAAALGVATGSQALAAELARSGFALDELPRRDESELARMPTVVQRTAKRVRASAVLLLPVHVDGRVGGSLELFRAGEPFDDGEIRLAQLAAAQASLAVRAFGAGALRFVFVSGGCSLRYAGGRFSGRAFPAAGLAFADERAGTTPGPRKTPGFGVAATGGFPWFAEAWNSWLFLAVCCCCICIGVACRCASRATAISAEVGRAVLPPFPPL